MMSTQNDQPKSSPRDLAAVELEAPSRNPNFRLHPSQRNKRDRRQHVVDSLLEYNRGIIQDNPSGANEKFAKLTTSPFVFFRGTADLTYRDLQGTDANMSTVFCMGDVHLENFGVMQAEDGTLLWGLNDFDEAYFAPFSWDVKRGAISVVLAAQERGFGSRSRCHLAEEFAATYLRTIRKFAKDKNAAKACFTKDHGPELIRKLIQQAATVDPDGWLMQRFLDSTTGRFRKTDEIDPLADRRADFQRAIDAYLPSIRTSSPHPPAHIHVLDVATKAGSGTGSIGLWRYYALVEVEPKQRTDKVLLELKQQRPSVLHPYVGNGPLRFPSEGSRIALAEDVQLPDANPFYGYTSIDGNSYLVRERSPYKARVKLERLSKRKKFQHYTRACGAALAWAHARSDRILADDESFAEQRILQTVHRRTFVFDIGRFAVQTAKQVTQDWKSFVRAYEGGAFRFAD